MSDGKATAATEAEPQPGLPEHNMIPLMRPIAEFPMAQLSLWWVKNHSCADNMHRVYESLECPLNPQSRD